MTPTRLRECLALLRWSQRGLAEALGRDEGLVRMMARGVRLIPPEMEAWLEALASAHAAHPAPELFDERSKRKWWVLKGVTPCGPFYPSEAVNEAMIATRGGVSDVLIRTPDKELTVEQAINLVAIAQVQSVGR